jgi:hypothetical protein
MSETTPELQALTARVESTRGALGDMRDWCEELGYPTAQTAPAASVVRVVQSRFHGGVDGFLTGY